MQAILDELQEMSTALSDQAQAAVPGSIMAKLSSALDLVHADLQMVLEMIRDSQPLVHDALDNLRHATPSLIRT